MRWSILEIDLDWDGRFNPANFERTLDRMLRGTDRRLQNEMAWGSAYMERTAKRRAPVDTGNLRGSIGSRVDSKYQAIEILLWAGADYARFVELGTSRMSAQPFLRPALDSTLPRLERRVLRAVAKAADSSSR